MQHCISHIQRQCNSENSKKQIYVVQKDNIDKQKATIKINENGLKYFQKTELRKENKKMETIIHATFWTNSM